jgi:flagellar basal body rod protein FlgC
MIMIFYKITNRVSIHLYNNNTEKKNLYLYYKLYKMKLITLSNRKGQDGGNTGIDANSFKVMFNNIITLPPNAQVALGGYRVVPQDPNADERVYVHLTNLPIKSAMANQFNGNIATTTLGGFNTSEENVVHTPIFLDLDNPEPINLSFIDVLLTNDVGKPTTDVINLVQIDLLYREKRE